MKASKLSYLGCHLPPSACLVPLLNTRLPLLDCDSGWLQVTCPCRLDTPDFVQAEIISYGQFMQAASQDSRTEGQDSGYGWVGASQDSCSSGLRDTAAAPAGLRASQDNALDSLFCWLLR